APLVALKLASQAKPGAPDALPGEARGLAYQLWQGLGSLDRQSATLPRDEHAARRALRPFGVRFGRHTIYLPALLRPDAASLLALLWVVAHRLEKVPSLPSPGRTSFERDSGQPSGFLTAAGFRPIGSRAIRLDILERLEDELQAALLAECSAETLAPKLLALLGCDRAVLEEVVGRLGWRRTNASANGGAPITLWRQQRRRDRRRRGKPPRPDRSPEQASPFASLARYFATD
ncbi:MAG TPA: hypothetical protein VN154_01830, partial [Rhizomicrobium sp.]|nr:hypothetical protein [Rhizomicrobium sp.]